MKVKLSIQRFNPETDMTPHMQDYDVEVKPTDRVIDVLVSIKRNIDSTLSFRRSCSHGICGSDAVLMKGSVAPYDKMREGLACKVLIKSIVKDGETLEIKPLRHFSIQRDLIIDQSLFYEKYKKVKPYLIPGKESQSDRETIQSIKEREDYDDPTKCIMCGACYSACPILDTNPDFIGPTALVQGLRFTEDSRDMGLAPRLDVLDRTHDGIWACENKFECTKVCPREIKITKLINSVKRKIKKYREDRNEKARERI